jgi:hypothetical protein
LIFFRSDHPAEKTPDQLLRMESKAAAGRLRFPEKFFSESEFSFFREKRSFVLEKIIGQ